MASDNHLKPLSRLTFRPERSRPIWRNKHTGTELTVLDLAINDHGGFQGGCRQFVVVTDEVPPPGPPSPPAPTDHGPSGHNVYPLSSFLEHWEPTDAYRDWTEASRIEVDLALRHRRDANQLRGAVRRIHDQATTIAGIAAQALGE